jgi:hypothetical protein
MKTFSLLCSAVFLLALTPSCRSTKENDLPCTCGTAMGDLEGCTHEACRSGKTNPDNPDCVCGELEIPAGKKD